MAYWSWAVFLPTPCRAGEGLVPTPSPCTPGSEPELAHAPPPPMGSVWDWATLPYTMWLDQTPAAPCLPLWDWMGPHHACPRCQVRTTSQIQPGDSHSIGHLGHRAKSWAPLIYTSASITLNFCEIPLFVGLSLNLSIPLFMTFTNSSISWRTF